MKLRQTIVFGNANEDRESGWSKHIEYVDWIDDERILYCDRSGWVTCRHLKSQTDLWRHQIEFKYADFSLCRNKQIFAMLADADEHQIVVIDCNSGEFLAKWTESEIADLLEVDQALPTNIALAPVTGKLLVTLFSSTFGNNGYILHSDYQHVERRFETDRHMQQISMSNNEQRIVMLADKYVVSVLDLPSQAWVYLQGERVYEKRLSEEGDSSQGINQVFHDGEDVLVIGHGGLNARIYVHSLLNDTVEFFCGTSCYDQRDIDFENQQIAITGLGKDLTIRSFGGHELAYLPDISLQQNSCIKLSPSLTRVLVGSWDSTVSVYEISPEADPDGPTWHQPVEVDIEPE